MKNFVDEYSVDYRDPIAFKSSPEKKQERVFKRSEDIDVKKSSEVFRKMMATVLVCASITGITYEALRTKESPTLLSSISLGDDARKYDDFIFPVVMQDPKPFEQIEYADPIMLVSASLWGVILSKRIDQFDSQGFGIIKMNEMWESYDNLFGNKFHPELVDSIETDFFKFDPSQNEFYIKPYTNQTCYIPYTQECRKNNNVVSLMVGYVSPNDDWRSLKPDKPKRPSSVRVVEYDLIKDDVSNKVCISAVKEQV